jgi:hypothetical protein
MLLATAPAPEHGKERTRPPWKESIMAAEKLSAEDIDRIAPGDLHKYTPEVQTEWMKRHMADWPAFAAGIAASHVELEVYRAEGGKGWPPGWISFREYMKERALRSDSQ